MAHYLSPPLDSAMGQLVCHLLSCLLRLDVVPMCSPGFSLVVKNWGPEGCIYTRELLVPLPFQMGSTDVVHIVGMGLSTATPT